jgi:DNA invertase Pin-like site-specific DNA recombinase
VSSESQDLFRQQELFKIHYPKIDKIFEEKVSGRTRDRPKLKEAIEYLRKGDILVVESYSRVSRSLKDLLNIIDEIHNKGAQLISINEKGSMDAGATPELIRSVMGAISQYEVAINRERQKLGIERAKIAGKYLGRSYVKIPEKFDICFKKFQASTREEKYTIKNFMEETKLKRSTLLRMIKEQQKGILFENREIDFKKKK